MEPVQFQCGNCGKLMGVSREHLGQQVRCPHCQHVVIAPPSAAATPASGAAEGPPSTLVGTIFRAPVGDIEDIFSPAEATDDLFDRSEGPRVELVGESLVPIMPISDVFSPPEMPAAAFSTSPPESASALPTSVGPFAPGDSTAAPSSDGAPPWPSDPITETLAPPPTELPPPSEAASDLDSGPHFAGARTRKRREQRTPWFLLLVFCPLLLYAIVISIFAFFLYRDYQRLQEQRRNPFETLPDVGDDPGVHKAKKVSLTDRYKPELATLPLPEHLCTTLGNPIRVGDLQITPNRVERKRVAVIVGTSNGGTSRPEACSHDSLVLFLDLKNLSDKYAFAPLDNYFDRSWRPGVDMVPPLTQLEIGDKYRCYGGPAHWYPRGDRFNSSRQWIEGRHDQADLLQPGEEKESFVCTDGDDAKAAALLFGSKPSEAYHGWLLWRVRVRRGLVSFQDKDYPATAVIGVRFTDEDIRQAPPEAQ
jgi:DNA-directed RNA polymerase subunit RPC12/RpoP